MTAAARRHERGTCEVCGRDVATRLDGKSPMHFPAPRDGSNARCAGSLRPTRSAAAPQAALTSTDTVSFFVPGIPAPQGSKRHVGHGRMVESSKMVEPWRAVVGWHGLRQHFYVDRGPVAVTVTFALKPPLRLARGRTLPDCRPDVDKLSRALLDALTGVCWRDDGQVVHLDAWKSFDAPTGAHITVAAL